MKWIDRYRVWRLRPGILFAAKLAEQTAWRHELCPEQNLLTLAHVLHLRLLDAEEGKLDGLYLDAVTHIPNDWKTVESEASSR